MRTTHRRRLFVERLEDRRVLAGSVEAFQSGGSLVIDGDDASNTISVESFSGGVVQVRGFNDITGSPTFVNQGANGLRLFFGINGDITIHMKGGNDLVRVTNLVVGHNANIDMGAGVDELITGREGISPGSRFGGTGSGPLYVQSQLIVTLGSESDQLFQSDAHIQNISQLDLGTGDDSLTIRRPIGSSANVEYFNDLTVFPRAGNDSINVTGLISFGLNISDETGVLNAQMRSMDIYGNLKIVGTAGADAISVAETNARALVQVESGDGADTLFFFGIFGAMNISSGDGNDHVTVTSSSATQVTINLGRNEDRLDLTSLTATSIIAHGNDGDDVFTVQGVKANDGTFYGDNSFDTYREPIVPPNQIRRFQRLTFERVETF